MKKELLFILLLCLFNCKTKKESSNANSVNMETIPSNLIAKGDLYGSGAEGIEAQNLIITNQNDWDTLKAQMNSVNKVSDGFIETTIDFSENTIIAVFDEVKGSGGHHLELEITSNSKNILVNITRVVPKGNATSVMTQPYHIIKTTKLKLPIKFLS